MSCTGRQWKLPVQSGAAPVCARTPPAAPGAEGPHSSCLKGFSKELMPEHDHHTGFPKGKDRGGLTTAREEGLNTRHPPGVLGPRPRHLSQSPQLPWALHMERQQHHSFPEWKNSPGLKLIYRAACNQFSGKLIWKKPGSGYS